MKKSTIDRLEMWKEYLACKNIFYVYAVHLFEIREQMVIWVFYSGRFVLMKSTFSY